MLVVLLASFFSSLTFFESSDSVNAGGADGPTGVNCIGGGPLFSGAMASTPDREVPALKPSSLVLL